MEFSEARKLFPGVNDKVFLDSACVSLAPVTAKNDINKFMDMALSCTSRDASFHHIAMDAFRRVAALEASRMFNVSESQVALVESTTHGLNIAAQAIPFNKDDEVIIAGTEFLQVAIPFSKMEEQNLLKIAPLNLSSTGHIGVDDIEKKINAKTKAICVSSVQWCSGFRLDMHRLGEVCKAKGIWLIVDGVHEAGVMNVDLQKTYCDFYIAGGHKWLNSPYGCGLLVLSEKALRLTPKSFGYLAIKEPPGGWGTFFKDPAQTPFRKYEYENTAKKFEIAGTSNYPGAIGLTSSLKIVNKLTVKEIEKYTLSLADKLRENLRKLNLKIISPVESKHRSAITVFQVSEDAGKNELALEKLLDRNILVSVRYTANVGGIRVSTHYFNNEEDIGNLCSALKRILAR